MLDMQISYLTRVLEQRLKSLWPATQRSTIYNVYGINTIIWRQAEQEE